MAQKLNGNSFSISLVAPKANAIVGRIFAINTNLTTMGDLFGLIFTDFAFFSCTHVVQTKLIFPTVRIALFQRKSVRVRSRISQRWCQPQRRSPTYYLAKISMKTA